MHLTSSNVADVSSSAPSDGDSPTPAYLLVDGENIDWSLSGLLKHRPEPQERPRWDRLLEAVESKLGGPAVGLFYINCPEGRYPAPFVQFLQSVAFRPVLVTGEGKVVDVAIQKTLAALATHVANVALASHDGDFVELLGTLIEQRDRRVAVFCFPELASGRLHELVSDGLEMFDLEHDVVGAFQGGVRLPRLRVVSIDEFDPENYLWLP